MYPTIRESHELLGTEAERHNAPDILTTKIMTREQRKGGPNKSKVTNYKESTQNT